MKIKPEERNTVIGLGSAIAVVLLFGASRLLPQLSSGGNAQASGNGSINASSPPVVAPASLTNAVSPTGSSAVSIAGAGALASSGSAGAKADMYSDTVNEPTNTRDPFTPAVPDAEVPASNFAPTVNSRPMPFRANPVAQGRSSSVTVLPLKPTFPFPGNDTRPVGSNAPGVDLSAQANQVVLAGVITGPQAVAVIHIGDRAYPLVPGERMPLNLSLARITDEGVYVKQGKQMWFIEVGKSLNAAMPAKPGMQGFQSPGGMIPNLPTGSGRRLTAEQKGTEPNHLEAASLPQKDLSAAPLLATP